MRPKLVPYVLDRMGFRRYFAAKWLSMAGAAGAGARRQRDFGGMTCHEPAGR